MEEHPAHVGIETMSDRPSIVLSQLAETLYRSPCRSILTDSNGKNQLGGDDRPEHPFHPTTNDLELAVFRAGEIQTHGCPRAEKDCQQRRPNDIHRSPSIGPGHPADGAAVV